jgi:hypothetical protein
MAKLGTCSSCGGFVNATSAVCPHCGKRVGRALLGLAGGALGGGALAFTLMACYGMAPCPDGSHDCYRTPAPAPSDDAGPSMPKASDPPPSTPVAAPEKK